MIGDGPFRPQDARRWLGPAVESMGRAMATAGIATPEQAEAWMVALATEHAQVLNAEWSEERARIEVSRSRLKRWLRLRR